MTLTRYHHGRFPPKKFYKLFLRTPKLKPSNSNDHDVRSSPQFIDHTLLSISYLTITIPLYIGVPTTQCVSHGIRYYIRIVRKNSININCYDYKHH